MSKMLPILSSGVELPDENWIESVETIEINSGSGDTHFHLFPKQGTDKLKCCRRATRSTHIDSFECEYFEDAANDGPVKFEGDFSADLTYPDISQMFENDMAELDETIDYSLTSYSNRVNSYNETMEMAYSHGSKSNTKHPQSIRTTANIIYKAPSNAHVPIIDHMLNVLVGESSSTCVADSENVYKDLVKRLTLERIQKQLLAALDPDIAKIYESGSFDFDTLLSLNHSKAESYPFPGIYLHVIRDEKHYGVFWLYVGAV